MTQDEIRFSKQFARRSSSVVRRSSVLGIDASRALSDAPTGTEYYSRALIEALLQIDSPWFFRLYTRAHPSQNFFPPTNNYEICALPFPRLWTHTRLAFEMLMRPPDALFVPAHVLPPIHPRNSIVTVHDLGYKFFPDAHPFFARAYLDVSTRWNAQNARVVLADSYATRDDVAKFYGTSSEKIRVVYPSCNAALGKPAPQNEIERVRAKYALAAPYLISVGTIQPRKNYARLLEAFAALPHAHTLVIVGKKGWLSDSIFQRVRALNLDARVKFLDYVPDADLPALYGGAQLAVVPSLYEGFGFPALEAQACGTPLVSSNASSLPEVAGEGALYFDPRDVRAMTRALQTALDDEPLRQALVEGGRANVKRFSWTRAAREIVEIVTAF